MIQRTSLTKSEQLVYEGYVQTHGKFFAERYKRERLNTPRPERERKSKKQRRAERRAEADEPIWGLQATEEARRIIGNTWRESLGVAYPLVLLLVKSALEAGHRKHGKTANLYHCSSTYWSLGALCAALIGKDKPFCKETILRWLSPDAPHAEALRCWIGHKRWYTGTLREFGRDEDGKFEDLGSAGARIGATVFRVYLNPLSGYQVRHSEAGGIYPLAEHMRHCWRNLDHERRSERTAAKHVCDMKSLHVTIRVKRTKDHKEDGLFFSDTNRTPQAARKSILSAEYLYGDIGSVEGARQLRNDVDACVEGILDQLGLGHTLYNFQTWRGVMWTVVKTHLHGDSRAGYDLLRRALHYAQETQAEEAYKREAGKKFKPVRNYGGFVMKYLKENGYTEMKRDHGHVRLFKRGVVELLVKEAVKPS